MLRFVAEGFEAEGGRSVVASNSVLVSPMSYLVGTKPDGDLNYLSKNTKMSVQLIAINSDLEAVPADKLTLKQVEFRYISTLVKLENGTYKYD